MDPSVQYAIETKLVDLGCRSIGVIKRIIEKLNMRLIVKTSHYRSSWTAGPQMLGDYNDCVDYTIVNKKSYEASLKLHLVHLKRDHPTVNRMVNKMWPLLLKLQPRKEVIDPTGFAAIRVVEFTDQLGEETCCICLDNFSRTSIIKETPCFHRFHSDCLEEWVSKQDLSCPLCRKPVK